MTDGPPTLLIILDGWGHRETVDAAVNDNAIALADTPVWDHLWENHAHCLISGSGVDVGLPQGQMGNSEVGHMSLGAGRVIHQSLSRINQAIHDRSFFSNPVLLSCMETIQRSDKALHLFGLLSPGGVHSHVDHFKATVDLARSSGVARIYVHAFLDGRDTPPRSADESLEDLQRHITAGGAGGIVSIIGRYYAMDRDNRWERTRCAYELITAGVAAFTSSSPMAALNHAYARDESDEFVQPVAIYEAEPVTIEAGDAVIFMNFRADRARQLSRCFVDADFNAFTRKVTPKLSSFITLTKYATDLDAPCAFASDRVHNSLGEYIASLGKRQLRLAETEKYAHVTFFFSGGREEPFAGEDRLLIPSPRVATYDLQPEMSANEVTDALVHAVTHESYQLIVCNYANGDMVGHTGNLAASIKAVECIDRCLGRIKDVLEAHGGQCLITADHGNVEQLVDPVTRQPHTAHTAELVPLIYVGPRDLRLEQQGGLLSDVAPTLLALMGLPQPAEMTGRSLLRRSLRGCLGLCSWINRMHTRLKPQCARMMRLFPAILVMAFACMTAITPPSLAAEDSVSQQDVEERLKTLEAKILKYQEELSSNTDEHAEIEARLRQNEKAISRLVSQMSRLKRDLEKGEAQAVRLGREQRELLTARDEQQHYLEQQITAAYEIGRAEYLKVLLNQDDPDEAARMLSYYDYFNRARARLVKTYQVTLDELDRITRALARENQELDEKRQTLSSQRVALDASQAARRLTLTTLNKQIRATGSALSNLKRDRGRLEQILAQLRGSLTELLPPETTLPFSSMRGKLLLPVVGKLRHRYGSKRSGGGLKWQGLVIAASEGEQVHVVHHGRVVFADWLRGFGWLIIIGHGEGYMSLYGHNQVLHRETGDWVTAGEVISRAGNSGGQSETGVYFEIRQAGKPGNPLTWCVPRDRDAV